MDNGLLTCDLDETDLCTVPNTGTCDKDVECSGTPVDCGQCQVCNPLSGNSIAAPNGMECDDGNACTRGKSTCQNGICEAGRPPKECGLCEFCDPKTGCCELAPKGTAFNDKRDLCTKLGSATCTDDGQCVGEPVECDTCEVCKQ